jgi:hypothetical protein
MSQTSADYQAIFDSALDVYKRKTGKDLTSHPLFRSFETCNSPDAVLAVLQAQILGPGQSQNSGDKLLAWLNPTITVLNAFSATVGGGVGLVSLHEVQGNSLKICSLIFILKAYPPAGVIFTGIGVLLSVRISNDRRIVTS